MAVGKRGTIYWMYFTVRKKRIQKSTGVRNKREAEEIERAYRTQLANRKVGLEPEKYIPTFSEATKEYLIFCETEHRDTPNTISSYTVASRSLIEFFRDKRIDAINGQTVENFKCWRKTQPRKNIKPVKGVRPTVVSNGTVNRELSCLRSILNLQIKKEVLTNNAVKYVRFLKENSERWQVIKKSEEELYLEVASQPLKDIAILMIETGCRQGELFNLKKEDVNLSEPSMFISKGKTKNARRHIPLSERARDVLRRRNHISTSTYIFNNESTGKPITTVKKAHEGAIRRSGLKRFRLYDYRHTFASRFIEAGGDLISLKEILGHANLSMILRYAHPSKDHQTEAIKRMEEQNGAKK